MLLMYSTLSGLSQYEVGLIRGRPPLRLAGRLPSVGISFPFGESQRDGAVEFDALGLINHAHPAFAKFLCDLVMTELLANHGSAPPFSAIEAGTRKSKAELGRL